MATDVAATWQYVAQMGAMGATALQTIAGSSWVAGWRVRSARGGGMGSERVPACQLAATAAIAANSSRNHHSRHLQHTPISRTHAGKHAPTCGWGVGMPPWEVGRWQLQRREGETGKTPRYKNPKWPYLWRPHVCDAGFDASSVPHGSGCLAVRSHSDPRRLHEHQ